MIDRVRLLCRLRGFVDLSLKRRDSPKGIPWARCVDNKSRDPVRTRTCSIKGLGACVYLQAAAQMVSNGGGEETVLRGAGAI